MLQRKTQWSRTIKSEPLEVKLGGENGRLQLNAICLSSGEQATLYCKTASGPRLAIGRVSSSKPCGVVGGMFLEPVTFSTSGGGTLVLNALLAGASSSSSAAAAEEPPAKRARAASDASPAPAAKAAASPKQTPASPRASPKVAKKAAEPAAAKEQQGKAAAAATTNGAATNGAAAANAKAKAEPNLKPEDLKKAVAEAAKAQPKAAAKQPALTAPVARKQFPGGLAYEVLKSGKGPAAAAGRTVQVRYDGRLTSGKRFDKGVIKFRLGLGEVIQGWDHGVKGMLRGESRRLLIPSKMGYGARGAPPDIPPNADLVFEVELLNC